MLARLFIIWYGGIQEPTCVRFVLHNSIYVLETVSTEKGTIEILSDDDENVVYVLGGDKDVIPESGEDVPPPATASEVVAIIC